MVVSWNFPDFPGNRACTEKRKTLKEIIKAKREKKGSQVFAPVECASPGRFRFCGLSFIPSYWYDLKKRVNHG